MRAARGTVLCHCGMPSGALGKQQFVGFLCNNSCPKTFWLPFWSITHCNAGSEQLQVQVHDPISVGFLPHLEKRSSQETVTKEKESKLASLHPQPFHSGVCQSLALAPCSPWPSTHVCSLPAPRPLCTVLPVPMSPLLPGTAAAAAAQYALQLVKGDGWRSRKI